MQKASSEIIEFTLYYNKYKRKLFNFVNKVIRNKMFTEDIIQDIFLKFFKNLNTIRNKDSIPCWLFKLARNEVSMYLRNKNVRVDQFNTSDPYEVQVVSQMNLADTFELDEIKNLIMQELDTMTIEQKEPFLLKEYGGLSYKEISQVMEIDEELVKSRLYKTRQKLLKIISSVIK
ncbi:MAG: sigma-70 family RNA polymerase sigma factor [Ignavibacteriales bacterium]|nr:sigma-70 family RNA polymerase sigma factor [Ignavibacteriales bacterium]